MPESTDTALAFMDRMVLGLALIDWVELLGITVVVTLVLMLVRRVSFGRFAALAERTTNRVDDVIAKLLHGMRTWFLLVVAFYLAVEFIASDAPAIPWLLRVVFVGFLVQIGLWGNDLIGVATGWYVEARDGDESQITAARAMGMVGRLVLWTIIFLALLDNFGVDVTALVAGLGIGGIAIALAVQNVLADLLAYVSIIADRPFVFGDFLVVGEHSGSVEHIGIKTTRIRSLSGEQIVFSNSDRHTLTYSTSVKVSMRDFKRTSSFLVISDFSIASRKRFTYHSSEYWYMGSTDARSAMQKNRMEERLATGS